MDNHRIAVIAAARFRFARKPVSVLSYPVEEYLKNKGNKGEEPFSCAPISRPSRRNRQDASAISPARRSRHCGGAHADRGAWMTAAHDTLGYTLAEIAAVAGLHYATVSKIIKTWRNGGNAKRKT